MITSHKGATAATTKFVGRENGRFGAGQEPARDNAIQIGTLGPLETQAMEILWKCGECNVRDMVKALSRHLAYTTVMTTLDRLFRKKLVSRRKCARAYMYSPCVTCQEWKDAAARDLLDKLMTGPQVSRELLIECLMEAVGQQDAALADEIARIAHSKTFPPDRPDNPLTRII